MQVSHLLKLGRGAVIELDRKVGEAIDIYVNNRLVARGEVVVVEDRLGITMTEIIKSERRIELGIRGQGTGNFFPCPVPSPKATQGRKAMRLLIVGQMEGHIATAGRIATQRGAKVAHIDSIAGR